MANPTEELTEEQQHWLNCSGRARKECGRCYFLQKFKTWAARLPLDPNEETSGTWLTDRVMREGWGAGCKVCKGGKFARCELRTLSELRISRLLQHQETKAHKRAVQRLTGGVVSLPCVPSVDTFLKVLSHKASGGASSSTSVESAGSMKTVQKLTFCLAETRRAELRRRLRDAKVIAMQQDACGKWLGALFVCADTRHEVFRGEYGLTHYLGHGASAEGICDAARDRVRKFCEPFHGAPYLTPKQVLRVQRARKVRPDSRATLAAIRNATTTFTSDAANDEVAAGKLLARPVDGSQPFFPNLRNHQKDPTHATKRSATTKVKTQHT